MSKQVIPPPPRLGHVARELKGTKLIRRQLSERARLSAPTMQHFGGNNTCHLGTILLIILVLLLIGALPSWPYSAAWGPAPAGLLGVVLIVVLILVLMGRF